MLLFLFEIMQCEGFSVKNGVGIAAHPLAQGNIAGFIIKGDIQGQMPVTEEEIVVVFCFEQVPAVNYQPLLLPGLMFFLLFIGNPAMPRPIIGYPYAKVRVYTCKKPLGKPAPEYF